MHVPILLEIHVVKTVVSDKRDFIIAPECMAKLKKKGWEREGGGGGEKKNYFFLSEKNFFSYLK